MIEQNTTLLSNLWEKYHDSTEAFNNLSIEDNFLVYENKKVDISNFSINYLFIYGVLNEDNILLLTSEDIFRLVRLYALTNDQILNLDNIDEITKNDKNNKKDERNNEQQLEEIKSQSPLLRRINIVTRYERKMPIEYINIVDDSGHDHLYINDRNFKINNLYELIKMNDNLTANEIVSLMDEKLPIIPLTIAGRIIDNEKTTESFINKIDNIDKKYKDDKTKSVLGNEEHDIIIVSDKLNPEAHQVLTFQVNEKGDLIASQHEQDKNEENNNTELTEINMNVTEEEIIYLIPSEQFYELINSNEEFTEQQRKEVNYYYEYLEDLVTYEDLLTEDLRQILINFRIYINNIQMRSDNQEPLTIHQEELLNKYIEWSTTQKNTNGNSLENVQKLTLKYKPNGSNYVPTDNNEDVERAGFTGTLQVILFVLAFATVLTAITLQILG